MQAAYEEFGCNDGNVFFLGIDKGNTNASVILFDSIYGIHYPSASGQEGNGNAVHWDYNIQATPSIVVILPDRSIPVKQIYPPSTENVADSVTQVGGIQQACLTGIKNEQSDVEVMLYPNPVGDYLSVSVNDKIKIQPESIKIYSYTGQQIDEMSISGRTVNKIIFNTGSLYPGLYFIEIRTPSKKVITQKFLKQ
ncbi:MAG: T9SS type A sorting domain-containing protein [Bacteroidetes bacterium]|nr:T9SS type A sorting domain-containing protein [Bacteroidota bacterium]